MRVQSLTLVAASAALLAPTTFPATPPPHRPAPPAPAWAERRVPDRADRGVRPAPPAGPAPRHLTRPSTAAPARPATRPAPKAGAVRAADLLAKVRHCTPVSHGRYRSDAGAPADIPVCGTSGAVFWKADLDVDCDGRPGKKCNRRTDPHFTPATAVAQSDGRPLDAERLPYVVVPQPSDIWDHRRQGVRGGSVAAVVHKNRVRYAVVGDVGPRDLIGEASYAAAKALGVPADPVSGGAASDVTYIVFKDSAAKPVEDPAAAAKEGERLARAFVGDGGARRAAGLSPG
ncbi:glycoside hydrolase family 75 protein [Streptomyces sp. NPDC048182]|uniref:glycoside hydrolase family 75 protein n=1 Tax=Streptomyces sp. NPDC048182 TaxID=3365507 RepID=UPI00371570A2